MGHFIRRGGTATLHPVDDHLGSRVDGAGKNFLTLLQHWSGAVTCPACWCGADGRWP